MAQNRGQTPAGRRRLLVRSYLFRFAAISFFVAAFGCQDHSPGTAQSRPELAGTTLCAADRCGYGRVSAGWIVAAFATQALVVALTHADWDGRYLAHVMPIVYPLAAFGFWSLVPRRSAVAAA